jgi:NADH:ubiquinone oxidoreductase subunit C
MARINFYIKYLLSLLPKFINFIIYKNNTKNTLNIVVTKDDPITLIQFLKTNSLFEVTCLNDVCVVDNPSRLKNRFEVCYNLLSVKYNFRFFIKACTNMQISSLAPVYSSAN